jgi:hypothetical protein
LIKHIPKEMYLPTVAVTTFAELVEITGAALDEATEAVVTCRATFEDGTGAGAGVDAGTGIDTDRLATLATVDGTTMAE